MNLANCRVCVAICRCLIIHVMYMPLLNWVQSVALRIAWIVFGVIEKCIITLDVILPELETDVW